MNQKRKYTAFENESIIIRGTLDEVVLFIKNKIGSANHTAAQIFDDITGKTFEIDFSGEIEDVKKRLNVFLPRNPPPSNQQGPGRPKLGVVTREISLLPEHWEWLALQSGGASNTIRSLVDKAQKELGPKDQTRAAQDAINNVMQAIAGHLENYEEVSRALYRKNKEQFQMLISGWPKDLKNYLKQMSQRIV